MSNADIRREIATAGLRLWEIAERLGITDSTFSRKLRQELSKETKTKIRNIIIELKKGK